MQGDTHPKEHQESDRDLAGPQWSTHERWLLATSLASFTLYGSHIWGSGFLSDFHCWLLLNGTAKPSGVTLVFSEHKEAKNFCHPKNGIFLDFKDSVDISPMFPSNLQTN